eukprot:m.149217 g.149217  ORF g.149217 m.149217 type:complete len:293 (+) comp16288_c0_seq1:977-1855(+)
MPLDLYIEKKKMKRLPLYLKLFNEEDRSICRLRLKAWLVPASLQDDDEDEVEYDEEASKLEFDDDEFDDAELDPSPAPEELPAPYDWVLLEENIRVSAVVANKLMFSEHSPGFHSFCEEKGLSEISCTEWTAEHTRDLSYLIPKSSIVKANHAVEHQKYLVRSEAVFVLDIQTETPEVPFGSSFCTQVQVRLQQAADGRSTHVKVTAQMQFYKSVGMMKGIIQSSGKKGMANTYEMFFRNVKAAVDRASAGRGGPTPALEGMLTIATCVRNTSLACFRRCCRRNGLTRVDKP